MDHSAYHIREIAELLKAKTFPGSLPDFLVKDILIDSRKLISPDHCIFFALTGKRNDGHRYIAELYDKGLKAFVVSALPLDPGLYPEASFLIVKNTLAALQNLAKFHRERFSAPVIGITGSNGKTIVKEWLFQLLSKDKNVVRSPKSYNSQIGVPLSVLQMNKFTELGIFEAGISEPDEMEKLQAIINPDIGIFTNIGPAHGENFISLAQKVGEKLKLFTHVKTLIYCADYPDIQEVILRSGLNRNIDTFTWSRKYDANLKIISVRQETRKTTIKALFEDKEISISIPFTDNASVENAIHCWSVMLLLGYQPLLLAERFMQLIPVAMRLELNDGINHCLIINDSYNSDVNSFSIAIDFLNQQASKRKKTVVLSDILQSGKDEDGLYSTISDILDKKKIDRLIGIGPAITRQGDKFNIEKYFFPTTEEFLKHFSFSRFSNEVILLKGARVFEFEQISKALQQKSHETVLEINLDALIHNLNHIRLKLRSDTRIMAMVKAFSYGTGSYEIANALQFYHIDYLAVAYADEGVELRKAGINVPIMVMNPDEEGFDAIIKYNLEPEIYSFRVLGLLEHAIHKNILPLNKPVKVHIKLDTGMHRLGFSEDEIHPLLERLRGNSLIYVQSVFTHLAASEDPNHDDFTLQQISSFQKMSKVITDSVYHTVLLHVLNSGGINRFPEYQFNMVRLGISLYGIPSVESEREFLQPVTSLKTTISQIKCVPARDSIGYNRSFTTEKDMLIGIVPIGYADGLSRKLSNGRGAMQVNGKMAPIVGNVCMDMTMLDLTGTDAKEGDEVIVFGPPRSIENLAKAMETIPYEVLTGISRRVKRIYYHE